VSTHKNQRPYNAALHDLEAFLRCADGARALISLDATAALRYKAWSQRRRGARRDAVDYRASGTTNQRLLIFRKFFRIAQAAGVARVNPFEGVTLLRAAPKRPTRALPPGVLPELILGAPELSARALLSALVGGGLRRSEAAKLTLDDVQEVDGVTALRLRATKNGTSPLQPLPSWAAEAVLAWRDERAAAGALPRSPLFVSHFGAGANLAPISHSTINRIVKRACARVGLDESKFAAHSLRATGVTELLRQGVDPHEVQEFGRFATLDMCYRYDKRRRSLAEHAGLKLKL
jgi:integrase